MIEPWLQLTLLMSVAGIIGYLAQRSGLCMIRGVTECRAGRPTLLLAMLLCGVCVWAFVPAADFWHITIPHMRYEWHLLFALGGLIFGLGTAANGGCSVSTLSRLARGDLHMLATVLGWVVGWCLWVSMAPASNYASSIGTTPTWFIFIELLLWGAVTWWVIKQGSVSRRLWFTIMGIGLLCGLMFVLQPHWSPSALVKQLADATLHGQTSAWPSNERYLLLLALVFGMLVAAWIGHRFKLQRISLKLILMHLVAGTAMGAGASMALGGNDLQLLLALPAASPAALVTVASMLLGIYIGIVLRQPLARFRKFFGA